MAALAAGPIAVGMELFGSDEAPPAVADAEVGFDTLSRRSLASETAADWVEAWLSTPRENAGDLKAWWAGRLDLPRRPSTVNDTRVVDAVATAPGLWSVTVATTVTPPEGEPSRRYYLVPVAVDGGAGDARAGVKAVPAPVQQPGSTDAGQNPYSATVPNNSPLGQSIQAFMNAYLTGEGDVGRYITPGSPLLAVSPEAHYASANVTQIALTEKVDNLGAGQTPADGQVVHALVDVALNDAPPAPDPDQDQDKDSSTNKPAAPSTPEEDLGDARTASWPLTLTARDGRWEVTEIDATFQTTEAAPAASEGATPTPTATPTGSTTTQE